MNFLKFRFGIVRFKNGVITASPDHSKIELLHRETKRHSNGRHLVFKDFNMDLFVLNQDGFQNPNHYSSDLLATIPNMFHIQVPPVNLYDQLNFSQLEKKD